MTIAARLAALERRRPRANEPATWTDRQLAEAIDPAFEQLTDEQIDLLADACEAQVRRQPLTAEQIEALQAWETAALPLAAFREAMAADRR
jgi:hypothetical protein